MTDQELVLTVVLWCCVNTAIGYLIGKHKNAVGAAITLSIFFGPIGWFITVLSRGNLRKCPFCAEHVKPEAVICRHCGNKLPPPQPPARITKKGMALAFAVVVVIAAGITAFVIFVPSKLFSPVFAPSRSDQPLATNPTPVMIGSSDSEPTPMPAPDNSPAPPEFVTITKNTEARIPETFEVIALKPGEQLRFVSSKGDQVRVQYGKFQAVVNLQATDLNHTSQ
jgi:hypothetical protein